MTKAEERALEAYPVTMVRRRYDGIVSSDDPYDSNLHDRYCFQRGYEQAEKDLGWISVKDKLPGPSEWVLACIEQHGHAQCLTLAVYSEETKEWHTDQWEDGEQETYNPDYWMPIPNIIKDTKK